MSAVSSMAACKRRVNVAGVIFSMILTTNVLCTTIIPCQSSVLVDSDERCTSDGDYCFVKQRGCAFYTGEDMMVAVLHINASLSIEHCMDTCKQYSCSAFQVINVSYSGLRLPPACIFFRTVPRVVTESTWLYFDVYIHTSKVMPPASSATSPPPGPAEKVGNPTGQPKQNQVKHRRRWLLGAVLLLPAIATCFLAVTCYLREKTARNSQDEERAETPRLTHKLEEPEKLGDELKVFRLKSICNATNQFSGANKIGEGGFGPVYKASLQDGQEVAVKRLSRSSSQGLSEFRNEIKLIARLQHRNLVRLLGCCLEGNEKMLVYELLPNKSLDSFLFDPTKKKILDWKKRLDIIEGTAQGLLYLHKHSRVKVIHRDLKTSNILLDMNLKPKISDFGMARIFEQNTSEASTNRVVGTYGYMSPEYAMAGLYSEKSDVFSFGVIVLEIMSGKKATSFSGVEHPFNLIRYAWDLWKEDQSLELVDRTISEMYDREELLRHIHVGLLCVAESVAERPTMSDVVIMLTNSKMALSDPKQPAFFCGECRNDIVVQSENCSPNLVTLSPVEGR